MKRNQFAVWLTALMLVRTVALATTSADELAIRRIIDEEVLAWNSGDAKAYSQRFAPEGTFTNIYGMVFTGHDAFEKRHGDTFATFFKGSMRVERIRCIRFVTPEVAIVDVDTEVRGFGKLPAGVTSRDGVLRTRLLQVFVRRNGEWWIEAYHNVDVKVHPRATMKNSVIESCICRHK